MISPQDYDAAEAAALAAMAPEMRAIWQPVAFEHVQHPTRVSTLAELVPFVDAMHQGEQRIWDNLGGGLTTYEASILREVLTDARRASSLHLGQEVSPRDALLQAVIPLRAIRRLCSLPCHVLELGPGSGYLSAMLRKSGFSYEPFEITQAFALWQRLLLGTATLFWWDQLDAGTMWKPDLAVACHMLNEMHPQALAFVAQQLRAPLLVEGYGSVVLRTREQTIYVFEEKGWSRYTLEEGPYETNHRIDLLLPPGAKRSFGREQFAGLYR